MWRFKDRGEGVGAASLRATIKHTPRRGQVTTDASCDRDEAILRVRDTGSGIPPESIPRIWDRLYRADPSRSKRGLGLGLSVVKAIATAHGGRVAVESELGRGSTFTIGLPRGDRSRAPRAIVARTK